MAVNLATEQNKLKGTEGLELSPSAPFLPFMVAFLFFRTNLCMLLYLMKNSQQ